MSDWSGGEIKRSADPLPFMQAGASGALVRQSEGVNWVNLRLVARKNSKIVNGQKSCSNFSFIFISFFYFHFVSFHNASELLTIIKMAHSQYVL
jgi:hypothetical protein